MNPSTKTSVGFTWRHLFSHTHVLYITVSESINEFFSPRLLLRFLLTLAMIDIKQRIEKEIFLLTS